MMEKNSQLVVDHMWWGTKLEVAVQDNKYGKVFRVQFDRAVDGLMKLSGGGGYSHNEEEAFNNAKDLAKDLVEEELGYEITTKGEWSIVKALRGLSYRERNMLSSLSQEEKQMLFKKLRNDEIDLSNEQIEQDIE